MGFLMMLSDLEGNAPHVNKKLIGIKAPNPSPLGVGRARHSSPRRRSATFPTRFKAAAERGLCPHLGREEHEEAQGLGAQDLGLRGV